MNNEQGKKFIVLFLNYLHILIFDKDKLNLNQSEIQGKYFLAFQYKGSVHFIFKNKAMNF